MPVIQIARTAPLQSDPCAREHHHAMVEYGPSSVRAPRNAATSQHAVSTVTTSREPIAPWVVVIHVPARGVRMPPAGGSHPSACALLSSLLYATCRLGARHRSRDRRDAGHGDVWPVAPTTSIGAGRFAASGRRPTPVAGGTGASPDDQARELEAMRTRLDDTHRGSCGSNSVAAWQGAPRRWLRSHRNVPGQPGSAAHARTAGPGRVRRRLSGIAPHSRLRRRTQDRRAGAHDAGAHARGTRHRRSLRHLVHSGRDRSAG